MVFVVAESDLCLGVGVIRGFLDSVVCGLSQIGVDVNLFCLILIIILLAIVLSILLIILLSILLTLTLLIIILLCIVPVT